MKAYVRDQREQERRVLAAIQDYYRAHQSSPPIRALMTASHLAYNTVMHTLQRLEDQGQIRRDGGKRLIALVQSQDTVSLVAGESATPGLLAGGCPDLRLGANYGRLLPGQCRRRGRTRRAGASCAAHPGDATLSLTGPA